MSDDLHSIYKYEYDTLISSLESLSQWRATWLTERIMPRYTVVLILPFHRISGTCCSLRKLRECVERHWDYRSRRWSIVVVGGGKCGANNNLKKRRKNETVILFFSEYFHLNWELKKFRLLPQQLALEPSFGLLSVGVATRAHGAKTWAKNSRPGTMKFSHTLDEQRELSPVEWGPFFLNYKLLKVRTIDRQTQTQT